MKYTRRSLVQTCPPHKQMLYLENIPLEQERFPIMASEQKQHFEGI